MINREQIEATTDQMAIIYSVTILARACNENVIRVLSLVTRTARRLFSLNLLNVKPFKKTLFTIEIMIAVISF